jgi:hypothetical protein
MKSINPGETMETGTESTSGKRKKRVVGRQDSEGQEQVIERGVIEEREEELVALKVAASEAAENYSEAIKKAAEDSGLNAGTVRKYIEAKAGDKFDATKKKVAQLALIFDVE